MLAKFAEDDRIEQMNAQKRRMKQLEHKRAVEALMEERRRQFAQDREKELNERKMEEETEAYRKQIIEEERLRLLRQHADKLLGYLPKVKKKIFKKISACTMIDFRFSVNLRIYLVYCPHVFKSFIYLFSSYISLQTLGMTAFNEFFLTCFDQI